jgi:phosphoribosyl-ATP pyrophosphohydrolase
MMKSFDELWFELQAKSLSNDPKSSTAVLIEKGVHEIGKKIVEEAAEVWLAAEYESKEALALEISQLIYYLQVMALAKGVAIEDIYKEL